MILAPPCPPPTLLVPPLNHLFPSHDFLRNSYSDSNCCHRTVPTRVFCNPIPRAFPRLSLSTPSPIHKRNKESRLLFRKQLQLLCLSALTAPSLETRSSKNNSKSRFLSLALPNSYYDEEPYIKEDEEEEEKKDSASAFKKEEEVPLGLNLLSELGLWAQLVFTHVALSMSFHIRPALTGFMSSPGEIWISGLTTVCTVMSASEAVQRYAYFAQERQKSVNDPSKSSRQLRGPSSRMIHFYDGVLFSFPGLCLAIMTMRSSVYSLRRCQEVGFISLTQSILKSLTPGSVLSCDLWPLKASTFHILSNLLALVCSLRCYNGRVPVPPRAVANNLGQMGLAYLSGAAIGRLIAWLST